MAALVGNEDLHIGCRDGLAAKHTMLCAENFPVLNEGRRVIDFILILRI